MSCHQRLHNILRRDDEDCHPTIPRALGGGVVFTRQRLAQHNPNGQIIISSLADPYLVLIRDPVVHGELRLNDQQRQAIRR